MIILNPYSTKSITATTPVTKSAIVELRDNESLVMSGIDNHLASKRGEGHAAVSTEKAGFATPEILRMLESYRKQLDILETACKNSAFPSGSIVVWAGDVRFIPEGWYLCDGKNGTPNMGYCFPRGVGNTEYKGSTGKYVTDEKGTTNPKYLGEWYIMKGVGEDEGKTYDITLLPTVRPDGNITGGEWHLTPADYKFSEPNSINLNNPRGIVYVRMDDLVTKVWKQ